MRSGASGGFHNGILSVPGQLIVTVLELVGGAPGGGAVPIPEAEAEGG